MDLSNRIISPIITEKSMELAKNGKFAFRVDLSSSKPQIRNAVEEIFKVKVISVATNIIKGKRKRVGARKLEVRISPWKKAIVRLKSGEKIDLFDIGEKNK